MISRYMMSLALAALGFAAAAHCAEYLEKNDFQKSRAFSPTVISGRS